MLRLKFQAVGIPVEPGVAERVLTRFRPIATKLLVEGVQSVLGTDEVYQFTSEDYVLDKVARRGFVSIPGKDPGQPLINSAKMYENIAVEFDGDAIILTVAPFDGDTHNGFDYVAYWQERTDFLGLGFDKVSEAMTDQLEELIWDELGFNVLVEL